MAYAIDIVQLSRSGAAAWNLFPSIGAPLLLNAWPCLAFSVLTVLGISARIRREEKELLKNLAGYDRYLAATWRLIPRIY